jgi:hypothetical protein
VREIIRHSQTDQKGSITMSGKSISRRVSVTCAAAAGLLSAYSFQQAFAQESAQAESDAAARAIWREAMSHNPESGTGCFQASYPSYVWERTECKVVHPKLHRAPQKPTSGELQVTGDGDDYVIQGTGLISETVGSFPKVSDVTSEKSAGVAAFGDGGILGTNEYSLQINTDFNGTTAACAGHSGCVVWQQFVYATDFETKGEAAVFIEYWLIGWGSSRCPSGWESDGEGDCVINSSATTAPDVAPTTASLAKMTLTGTAVSGGHDTVVFNNGTTAFSLTASDSVVDIAQVWQQSEFNIVGDAGGSRADFNKGASITVKVAVTDGSTAAPSCIADEGTTGETNNLNLGACTAASGTSPSIQFTESD